MKTRVFLVDDEPIVRRGLRALFDLEPNLTICGAAGTEHDALEGILGLQPDLAVVDLSLKRGDGLGLIEQLHRHCPGLKILVFSLHDQVHLATAAFAAGAHGYLIKEEGAERVLEAIQSVMSGAGFLSPQIATKAPQLVPPGVSAPARQG